MNSRLRIAVAVVFVVVSFIAGSFTRVGPHLVVNTVAPLARIILQPRYTVILTEAAPQGVRTARVVAVVEGGATVDNSYYVVLADSDEAAIDAARKQSIWSAYGLAPSGLRWLHDDILEIELSVDHNVGMGRLGSIERKTDRGVLVVERVRVVEN